MTRKQRPVDVEMDEVICADCGHLNQGGVYCDICGALLTQPATMTSMIDEYLEDFASDGYMEAYE